VLKAEEGGEGAGMRWSSVDIILIPERQKVKPIEDAEPAIRTQS
jgi:hypothetical protein